MFKWIYRATIYRKVDGIVRADKICKTYIGAMIFIMKNIARFDNNDYPPTGHISKEYIKLN